MTELRPYPDIEAVVRELIFDVFADLSLTQSQVGRKWPTSVVPYFRVERTAMSRRTKLVDMPVVDIEVLGKGVGGPTGAKSLASRLEEVFLCYPLSVVVDDRTTVLDSITIPVSYSERDWQESNVARYGGTYQFIVRR